MLDGKQSVGNGSNDLAAALRGAVVCHKDTDLTKGVPELSGVGKNGLRAYLDAAAAAEAAAAAVPLDPAVIAARRRRRRYRLVMGLSTLCVAAIVVVLIVFKPFRAPDTLLRDGLTLVRVGDAYVITEAVDGLAAVEIPAKVRGLPVTEIADGVFRQNTSLLSVTVPPSVTRIGASAFDGCEKLALITIPDTVTEVGANAFRDCAKLTVLCEMSVYVETWGDWNPAGRPVTYLYPDEYELEDITYEKRGEGYVVSGSKKGITVAEIPDTLLGLPVTGIEKGAFKRRRSLRSVTVGDGVVSIGEKAFRGCRSLLSVTLGDGVEEIGWAAFKNCRSLRTVTFGEALKTVDGYAFHKCRALTAITLPDGVKTLGMDAFASCSSLGSVTLGKGLTHIGSYAFEKCKKLASVYIPATVECVESGAFSACTELTIYCEAEAVPDGWDNGWFYNWNADDRPVVWGYQPEE